MKKAGTEPCLDLEVDTAYDFLSILSADFLSAAFLSDFFLLSFFASVFFASFLSFLFFATAAQLAAANAAATRAARSCFIGISSLWWFVERPALGAVRGE